MQKLTFMFAITLSLFFLTGITYSQQGVPVNEISYPKSVNLSDIPQANQTNILSNRQEAPQGIPPHSEEIKLMKKQTLPVYDASDRTFFKMDLTDNPLEPPKYVWNTQLGPNQVTLTPADVDIAAGAFHKTIVVTNSQFHIYDSLGNQISVNQFSDFFASLGTEALMFDPKVIYDVHQERWVMVIMGLSNDKTRSWYYIAASQTNNPMGTWWIYKSDARLDGGTNSTNWADLPCVGFSRSNFTSPGAIAIGTNQYSISNDIFQYGKVRLFRGSIIYFGLPLTLENTWDFYNFYDLAPVEKSFSPSPSRNLTFTSGIDVVTTKNAGGSVVNVRHIYQADNPPYTPNMQNPYAIAVTPYVVPPDGPSLGGSGTIMTGDCRTRDVYFLGDVGGVTGERDYLYTAFATAVNWGSGNNGAIQYERLQAGGITNWNRQVVVGAANTWFMYPCAAPEYRRMGYYNYLSTRYYAGIGFSITSSTMYPSYCVIGDDGAAVTSYSVINGTGYLGSGNQRFGDYSGIAPDPSRNGEFHAAGMLAKAGSWGTGIFNWGFNPIPVSGTVTYSDNGNPVASRGIVYAFHYDVTTAEMILKDSMTIDPNTSLDSTTFPGFYSLNIFPADSCYLLYFPNLATLDFIPTFYKSNGQLTLDWRLSNQVYPTFGLSYNQNMPVLRNPFASGYSISGTATSNTGLDVTTGPLQYAIIYAQIGSVYKGFGMSGSNGNYIATGLPAGSYTLTSHRIGYNPQTQNVVITNSNLTNVNFNFGSPIGIQTIGTEIPSKYSLSQNYPNPFNPVTRIIYGIPKSGNVKLAIYDILGKEVAVIINGHQDAGKYRFDFNASGLSSGIYFYQLISNNFTDTKKMILTK